jgi:hypothetical protein
LLEAILEFLVELVLDALLEALFELACEVGIESLRGVVRPRQRAHPALATIGLLLLGSGFGAVSAWLLPRPLIAPGPVPGISVLLSPLLAGLVMQAYGTWAEGHGRQPSLLATFWGGSGFAFAFAISRRVILQGWRHAA